MICDTCKQNPATYGDGVTWARCSACQLKHTDNEPEQQEQPKSGVSHQTIKGLTSVIMPVYNVDYSLFHYTGNAIGALKEHTPESEYEFIVVDNGSPIQPPNLNSYYADKIIQNEKNEGFTKAVNQGIRASFGEYIVILNNDTQVYNHWLEDIRESLEHVDLVMAYPMYSNTEPFSRATESAKIRGYWTDKPIQDSFSDFRDFSCVGFRKQLVDDIGLFDEDFFNYASDSEFLDRMEANGKKFASCKRLAIHHIIDATGHSIAETPEIMNRDKEIYAQKKENVQKVEATSSPDQSSGASGNKDDRLVRSNLTGDKVFLVRDNRYHWIKSGEVFSELGFDWGKIETVDFNEVQQIEKGDDITEENINDFK